MTLNSDELLVVLALYREKTLENASGWLGRDSSSVFRAIKRIEAKVGAPLFTRSNTGFHPLPLTEELANKGRDISNALSQAEAVTTELSGTSSGRLRITTTDILLEHYILPNIHRFRSQFPEVDLEFGTSNLFAKMWERDFDVALRPSSDPPDHLIGHFLRPIGYKLVYAANSSPLLHTSNGSLKGGDWLVPGGTLSQHPIRRWVTENVTDIKSLTSFDSMGALTKATQSGQGYAVLPDLSSTLKSLKIIDAVKIDITSELWCLYHPSKKKNVMIMAFIRFMRELLKEEGSEMPL
jgi:DNA-binding transcriptional LysR family regulator